MLRAYLHWSRLAVTAVTPTACHRPGTGWAERACRTRFRYGRATSAGSGPHAHCPKSQEEAIGNCAGGWAPPDCPKRALARRSLRCPLARRGSPRLPHQAGGLEGVLAVGMELDAGDLSLAQRPHRSAGKLDLRVAAAKATVIADENDDAIVAGVYELLDLGPVRLPRVKPLAPSAGETSNPRPRGQAGPPLRSPPMPRNRG